VEACSRYQRRFCRIGHPTTHKPPWSQDGIEASDERPSHACMRRLRLRPPGTQSTQVPPSTPCYHQCHPGLPRPDAPLTPVPPSTSTRALLSSTCTSSASPPSTVRPEPCPTTHPTAPTTAQGEQTLFTLRRTRGSASSEQPPRTRLAQPQLLLQGAGRGGVSSEQPSRHLPQPHIH
jgi:hypothetical protein